MAAQAKENYKFLKAKVGELDLRDLLRPHFAQLLEETIDPTKVAIILFKRDVISMEQLDECRGESMIFYQNLDIYQAVKKKNAGEALLEALYETGNFHILQLLQLALDQSGIKVKVNQPQLKDQKISKLNMNNLNISVKMDKPAAQKSLLEQYFPKQKEILPSFPVQKLGSSSNRVSVLKSALSTKQSASINDSKWNCIDTIGRENLSRLQVDSLDSILVRVVTTTLDAANSPTCITLHSKDMHLEEETAIITFLESQLEIDLDKQTMARPPRELYINTRSFTWRQWDWLTKILFVFCGESLEHLWLDEVDYREYSSGIKWMNGVIKDENPHLRFTKLKVYIFQGSQFQVNRETFRKIFGLVKSVNCPLLYFWYISKCQVQIWENPNFCSVMLDPTKNILFCLDDVSDLQQDINDLFRKHVVYKEQVPIVRLLYNSPPTNIFTNGANLQILTHLCVYANTTVSPMSGRTLVIEEVTKYLSKFSVLQNLMLIGRALWDIELSQLDVLDHLSYIYMEHARVNRLKEDPYSWRKSVKTVIFNMCQFLPGTSSDHYYYSVGRINYSSLKLKRNGPEEPSQPFSQTEITDLKSYAEILNQFFN